MDEETPRHNPRLEEVAESERLDLVFGALSDPVRREILTRLDAGELLVSELAEPFDISLQAVSRHIQVLVKAGLVNQERTGRVSRCRLESMPLYTAAVWLNRYSKYWQEQFDTLAVWLETLSTPDGPSGASTPPANKPRAVYRQED